MIRRRFYSDPTQDPDFKAIQEQWYQKLFESGFTDHEDHTRGGFEKTSETYVDADHGGRPLKRWSGVSTEPHWNEEDDIFNLIDVQITQPAERSIISSWPDPLFQEEEDFSNHPEFISICESICRHGNSVFTTEKIVAIWRDYCNGESTRTLEKWHGVSDNRILVVIGKIREWMNFMEHVNEAPEEETSQATVVIRPYRYESDAPFIYTSWRNNLWFEESRDDRTSDQFYSLATKEIKALLSKKNTQVRIACLKEDQDFIVGYVVLAGENLEWAYVKIKYRNKGVGKLLSKGFKTVTSPATKIGRSIASKHQFIIKENQNG